MGANEPPVPSALESNLTPGEARRSRMIVLSVDGDNENPEAEANLLEGLAVTSQDIVIAVRRFFSAASDLPNVSSVTTL